MVEGTGPNPKPATSWQWDLRHTTDSASQLESATESSHFELLGGMRHDACGAPSIRQRGRSSLLLPPASLTFGTSRFPRQGCTSLVPGPGFSPCLFGHNRQGDTATPHTSSSVDTPESGLPTTSFCSSWRQSLEVLTQIEQTTRLNALAGYLAFLSV